jgi:hypothetical protein
MIEAMGLKKYDVKVTFSGMTFPLNFMIIYRFVQKLLVGTETQMDRQHDLISITFLF